MGGGKQEWEEVSRSGRVLLPKLYLKFFDKTISYLGLCLAFFSYSV